MEALMDDFFESSTGFSTSVIVKCNFYQPIFTHPIAIEILHQYLKALLIDCTEKPNC